MPKSPIIVRASKQRRGRKPLPHKPEPACGPIVRHVRGTRVKATDTAQSAPAESPRDLFEQLKASLRSKG